MIKTLYTITQQKLVLPFYHAVSNDAPPYLKHLYKVRSVKQFENDLNSLLKYYEPISIEQLLSHVQGVRKIKKPSFFISFDDGLKEFKEFAFPLLQKKGIPSALFVNTSFVDNKQLFFRFKASLLLDFISENKNEKLINEANEAFSSIVNTVDNLSDFIKGIKYDQAIFLDNLADLFQIDFKHFLEQNKPYLSKTDLQEMANQGVHIGAHSKDHPLFSALTDDEKFNQITDSVSWVKNNLNQSINSFSYPFTDYEVSGDFFKKVFNNETPRVDLTFGTAGIKNEHFKQHLQRIPIEDYSHEILQILRMQYMYYLAKVPFFKNTIKR